MLWTFYCSHWNATMEEKGSILNISHVAHVNILLSFRTSSPYRLTRKFIILINIILFVTYSWLIFSKNNIILELMWLRLLEWRWLVTNQWLCEWYHFYIKGRLNKLNLMQLKKILKHNLTLKSAGHYVNMIVRTPQKRRGWWREVNVSGDAYNANLDSVSTKKMITLLE